MTALLARHTYKARRFDQGLRAQASLWSQAIKQLCLSSSGKWPAQSVAPNQAMRTNRQAPLQRMKADILISSFENRTEKSCLIEFDQSMQRLVCMFLP